jgi:hypothetical protein
VRCGRAAAALGVGFALALAFVSAAPVRGQRVRAPGETPIADVLQVIELDRELVAVDGLAGTEIRVALELGERVLWTEARGRVGLAVTDRRLLAVATRSGAWQSTRFRRGEAPPEGAFVGEQVAIAVTSKRALGFDGGSGNLVERSLGPRERVIAADASGAVGLVVTDRRALGVSPFAGGFFTTALRVGESIEAVAATGNVATVRTSRRLLTFQAVGGLWVELDLFGR